VLNNSVQDGTGGDIILSAYTAEFVTASATLAGLVPVDGTFHPWVKGRNNQAAHDAMRGLAALHCPGLRIGRGTDSADGYNFPHAGLGNGVLAMKCQSVHTLTEAQMDAVCDLANTFGATIVWMLHEVTQNGGAGVETSIARHEYLLNRIARDRDVGFAAVRTMGELGRELYAERLVAASLL
jgi:hypothetical protein